MKAFWQRRKWWILGGVAALVLVALLVPLLTGGLSSRAAAAQGAGEGERVEAFIGDLSSEATATGTLVAGREAALALSGSGTIASVSVAVGDEVSAGDPLVQLETGTLARDVETARQALAAQEANLADLTAPATDAALAAAEANAASAQAQLDDLRAGPNEQEIAAAEADVRAAQADVNAAAARLNSAGGNADPDAIRAAEIELELAQAAATSAAERHSTIIVTEPNQFIDREDLDEMEIAARAQAQQANADLAAAQAAYDELLSGDPASVAAAQAGLAAAGAQRDAAQAQLDMLRQGPTAAEIASAESALAQAQVRLEQLRDGPSANQIAQADVAVEQARIGLRRAERALSEATLLAPFDGVITAVNARPGETASGVLVEMVDPDSLEVVLDVDEIDMADVRAGQPAEVTLETWPDTTIPARVEAIAPQATPGSDLVTYRVYLSLGESDLPLRVGTLRVGMTANASLEAANLQDVLLLPNAAIRADRQSGTFSVNLVTRNADGEESVEQVPVTIGLRDRSFTQITGGLEAGDQVIVGDEIPQQRFGGGPGAPDGDGGGPFGE